MPRDPADTVRKAIHVVRVLEQQAGPQAGWQTKSCLDFSVSGWQTKSCLIFMTFSLMWARRNSERPSANVCPEDYFAVPLGLERP